MSEATQLKSDKLSEALRNIAPVKLKADAKFYKVHKDTEGNFIKIKIDKLKFIDLLYELGFRRYDIDQAHIFVRVVNHRILQQVRRTIIEDEFFEHLKKEFGDKPVDGSVVGNPVTVQDLINAVLNQRTALFNEELLYRLRPREPIVLNQDQKEAKYIYFLNGFVKITKDGFDLIAYEKLEGFIWENELIKRNFRMPRGKEDMKPSVFEKFLLKVCNEDPKRLQSLKTITGYNLHFYTFGKLKVCIFTDSRISEDDEANGRTGKTLYGKGLGYVLSPDPDNQMISTYCELNGKDFDPKNKNKYQQASIDTKVIVLNDVRRNFDIDCIYNDVTEGVTVERKNMQPFRIKPKMIITTNKTIKVEGGSGRDRVIEFEFGDYFSEKHSPEDEFKHWFFRDWNTDEWNRFYVFMVQCIKAYLESGLIKPVAINLDTRKIKDHTSPEFMEWINSKPVQFEIENSIATDKGVSKNYWFEQFTSEYTDFKNHKFTQAKFSRWIAMYCRHSGIALQDFTERIDLHKTQRQYLFSKPKS